MAIGNHTLERVKAAVYFDMALYQSALALFERQITAFEQRGLRVPA